MFEPERLEQILTILRRTQTATVKHLAQQLYVSEATVRRDLNELERRGFINRIHGGAVLTDGATREVPLFLREQQNTESKRIIAAKAAQHLCDGQVIFLDASSTAMYLIPHFERFQNLTIITNGLKTSQNLRSLKHNVYCTGGLMLHNSLAYIGDFAAEFIRHFNADIFFFSSLGISEDGRITDASSEETNIRRIMLEQSRKHIFLCDSSKQGKTYCYNLCNLSQVDDYISDK
ncbi:MAG: DeoR/GlpR transcriptional regulator [Oscillospiraceae bacterium]|nr:DeoR/GlpR transcriptional regulator [Oscillospiraceae bacterium]